MRKILAGVASSGVLFLAAAVPAGAAPSERACSHDKPHGTERAHATVPHANHQAHASIPHFCQTHP